MLPQYRRDWDDVAAEGIAALIAFVVMLVAIFIAVIVIRMIAELVAIYLDRVGKPGPASRLLWIALGVLAGLLLIAAAFFANPVTAGLGVYIASGSLLLFTIAVIGVDVWAERQEEQEPALDEPEIGDVLRPWQFDAEQNDVA